MKIQEISINNIVKTCTPDMKIMIPYLIEKVQAIDYFGNLTFCVSPTSNDSFSMAIKHVTGVELTTEILKKIGATEVNYKSSSGNSNYWYIDYNDDDDEFFVEEIKGKFYLVEPFSVEINFLHELQNIYFFTTAKEIDFSFLVA